MATELNPDDSPLCHAYYKSILPSLVYITRSCVVDGEPMSHSGTGTVVGRQGIDGGKGGNLPLILTAAHVIEPVSDCDEEIVITLDRFDFETDPAMPSCRRSEFTPSRDDPRGPLVNFYTGPNKGVIDIGFIRGPLDCTDGQPFFEKPPSGAGSNEGIAPCELDWNWAGEGTRVAWAGFPYIVSQIAGRPQMSYFEGTVSSFIVRNDGHWLYLIDGHNTLGVSGGPVWAMDANGAARVVAVISSYRAFPKQESHDFELPGFVHAVPVQPLVQFLKKHWRLNQSADTTG